MGVFFHQRLIFFIALFVFLGFAFYASGKNIQNTKVNSETDEKENPESSLSSPSPSPSSSSSPSSYPSPSLSQKANNDFKYPNSVQISVSGNTYIYNSNDDPEVITNWYKDKITSLGMNAKSFVTTNANNNILNKLVGAKEDQKIEVEITKSKDDTNTKIIIKI